MKTWKVLMRLPIIFSASKLIKQVDILGTVYKMFTMQRMMLCSGILIFFCTIKIILLITFYFTVTETFYYDFYIGIAIVM